jgi:serine/threonine protein kinase
MHNRTALNPASCEPLEKSHLIVLREAIRGDLNDYLPRFGRMTEKMARTYFRQLVDGLSSAARLKPAIYHPNLQASSILLD